MQDIKIWWKNNWQVVIIISLAVFILIYKIDKPFWGHHDWNGVYWGNIARNYVRYGWITTKFGMVENVGLTTPQNFEYTFHYSPLFPLIWSTFWKLFGIYEWSARLMAIIFSAATLTVFYFLIKELAGKIVAVVASFLWMATPMYFYYGKMPVHENLVMFFSMAAFYFFIKRKFKTVYFLVALAELTSWPGYFIVPAVTFYWLLTSSHKSIRSITNLWLMSVLIFLSLLLHNQLLTGSIIGGGLKEIFIQRVSSVNLISYVILLGTWVNAYYTPILLIFALFGLVFTFRKNLKWAAILLMFLIFASMYPVIFREASFRHDYLLIYLLPIVSFAGSLGLTQLPFPRAIKKVVVAAIIFLIILIRRDFIAALLNSDIYRQSVLIGRFIESHTTSSDKVGLEINSNLEGIDGWFISFYADRNYIAKSKGQKYNSEPLFCVNRKGNIYISNGDTCI